MLFIMFYKIICINNDDYPLSLELNKEYMAKKDGDFYVILDETFEEYYYPKEMFKIIETS